MARSASVRGRFSSYATSKTRDRDPSATGGGSASDRRAKMELSLYHEQQLSALCGVHALNNLMQGPVFGAGDLASIAHGLDDAERALIDPAEAPLTQSHRIDVNTGDFAYEVLAKALEGQGAAFVFRDLLSGPRWIAPQQLKLTWLSLVQRSRPLISYTCFFGP